MSPETETNYTLISAQFGWRLARRRAENGEFVIEWRCAECWRDHKKKTQGDEAGSGASSTPARGGADRARAASSVAKVPAGAARASHPPGRASAPPSRPPAAPRSSSRPPSSASGPGGPLGSRKRP